MRHVGDRVRCWSSKDSELVGSFGTVIAKVAGSCKVVATMSVARGKQPPKDEDWIFHPFLLAPVRKERAQRQREERTCIDVLDRSRLRIGYVHSLEYVEGDEVDSE